MSTTDNGRIPDKTGGPAFPRPCGSIQSQDYNIDQEGMTLRDYFAGQVLCSSITGGNIVYIAKRAYEIADAILAARKDSDEAKAE